MQYSDFEYADNVTKQLLTNFKQKDLEGKVFIKIKDQFIIARTVEQLINSRETLSDKIYYHPSRFPLLSTDDLRLGTAWKDWSCPNFNTQFCFNKSNNKITVRDIFRSKISLDQYIEKLHKILDNNISKILNKNKNLFFCYSKGIDSAVILSYLIKKKMQDKVTLINFSNPISNGEVKILDQEKKLGFNIEILKICIDDLIEACNSKIYENIICYTTYTISKKYKKGNFIYGFHGNQSLLHKKIFLEQVNKDVLKKGYCVSLNAWKAIKNPTPLAEHCFLIKPWDKINGINGCKIFSPLGNEKIFEMIRCIDWNGVDPHVISNAMVAKQIINYNVGNLLDSVMLQEENTNESDTIIGDIKIPTKKLDNEIFDIREQDYHNKEAYSWLIKEHMDSKKDNFIKLNTLVSFLLIKNISNQLLP